MSKWRFKPATDHGLPTHDRLRSPRREAGLFSATARHMWWSSWYMGMKVWNRFDVIGREHLPNAPSYVLIANHESHLDVFALAAALPRRERERFLPLAADDVFFNDEARAFLAAHVLNALPLRRSSAVRHSLASMRQRLLEEPTIFSLFPAGKRSKNGAMLPFRSGIGMLVAGTSIPVVPCHIEGAWEAMSPGKVIIRPARMTVRIGAPRTFADVNENREGWDAMATVLERDVRALGGEPEMESKKPDASQEEP